MRLGFDLDGTLADLQGALGREAGQLFPSVDPSMLPRSASPVDAEPSPDRSEDPPSARGLTDRQQHALWSVVCKKTNFWEMLDELEPGALARLFRLSQERRWDVLFLTSRPETDGDTAQAQSHRWLVAHGFSSPSVFVVHGSRGKIAAALQLDAVIDDRPENCLDVAIDSTARAILVWREHEDKVPGSARQLGIGAVKSVHECLDVLEELDRPEHGEAGVVERLKRLLGLKPRAARLREPGRAAPEPVTQAQDATAASSSRR